MDILAGSPIALQIASAAVVGIASSVAIILVNQRTRKNGEPPLVAGWVPYLGVAPDYGKDAARFLNEARENYGPIFTIHLAGRRMTFVLDPQAVPAFYRNKTITFEEIEFDILENAFQARGIRDLNQHLRQHYKHLHDPETLRAQSARYHQILEGILLRAATRLNPNHVDEEGWITGGVWSDATRWLFDANLATIFGDGLDSDAIYEDLTAFDKQFPLAAAGMPDFMLKDARKAQARIAETMSRRTLDPGNSLENASKFIKGRSVTLKEHGATETQAGRLEFTILWAAQTNAMPAAFWTLAHILTHPHILSAVQSEISNSITTSTSSTPSPKLQINLQTLPLLDACINESLRLASSSLSLRVSKLDQELDLKTGDGFRVRKGDYVVVSSHHIHFDPEIYTDPTKYDPYRFYTPPTADGTKSAASRIPHLPFGGGTQLCPGRFLARNEIKTLVALILYAYDVKVETTELPPLDQSRFGFGILPPVGDLEFKYRLRSGILAKE
ncbi:hypothetical protein HK097_001083 [Rhizophlyctis rosea]|uniref:Cytochrome P450 n=1 Tax=Rhizophlyctis rosea TaxID=64517 RepID=A0AAD5S609_9FUNG|nr:hypothetical protein HK097_001083 [Rhizophlyctis rosea]